jgi:hypothetical protein
MIDLGALSGQVVSEARAINDAGLIAGKSNFFPVTWRYDPSNPGSTPVIQQLPIPAGFFAAQPAAVNEPGDVVGHAGSRFIDSHAILWRGGRVIEATVSNPVSSCSCSRVLLMRIWAGRIVRSFIVVSSLTEAYGSRESVDGLNRKRSGAWT